MSSFGGTTPSKKMLRIDPQQPYTRPSIVLTRPESQEPILPSAASQAPYLAEFCAPLESELLHQVTLLKSQLRSIRNSPEFWRSLAKSLTIMLGAQYACISKRLDTIESNSVFPSIDAEGSCIQALARYRESEDSGDMMYEDVNYTGFAAPCGLMAHNTTALIPYGLNETFPSNLNSANISVPLDAYLSVPMFDGKGTNVGHICVLFTKEGRKNCPYLWTTMEFVLHIMVEMATQRFLENLPVFDKEDALAKAAVNNSVSADVTLISPPTEQPNIFDTPTLPLVSLSFPGHIAAKISHEIRTPLQGIVGLLEILYAQLDTDSDSTTPLSPVGDGKMVSRSKLKNIIEGVQANSNRLTEFTDKLVDFYALGTDIAPPFTVPTRKRKIEDTDDSVDEEIIWATDGAARKFLKRRKLDTKTTTEADSSSSTEHHSRTQSSRGTAAPNNQVSIRSTIRQIVKHVLTRHEVAAIWGGKKLGIMSHDVETRMKSVLLGEGDESLLLGWKVAEDVPRWLHCGKTGFQKAISQLLVNAIKFTPRGRVTLQVKRETARLCPGAASNDMVVFSINDTGIGVAPQSQHYIAQPFFQVDASMTRSRDGSGLGLLLTQRWATKNGGDLRLENSSTDNDDPHRGSEFSLRLPIDKRTAMTEAAEDDSDSESIYTLKSHNLSSSPSKAGSRRMDTLASVNIAYDSHLASLYPFKIMVVEDNHILRRVMSQLLEKLGYKPSQIVLCTNGKEAVDYFTARAPKDHDIDLILMDCWMPVMNGLDATQQILDMFPQNNKRYPGIKPDIVAITADNLPESLAKAETSGMRGYMVKPIKLNDLQRVVEECAEGNWIMNKLSS